MAGAIYIPGMVKLEHSYQGDRDTAINIQWLASTEADEFTSADLTAIATAAADSWVSHIIPLVSSAITYLGCTAIDYGSAEGLSEFFADPTTGGSGSAEMSAQVCAVLGWQGLRRYKGGHSRSYIPGVPSSLLADNQTLSTAAIDSFNTGGTDYIAALNAIATVAGVTFTFSILHGKLHNPATKAPIPPYLEPILQPRCDTLLGTQRRRLRRVAHT
jgi:hypothetical protein